MVKALTRLPATEANDGMAVYDDARPARVCDRPRFDKGNGRASLLRFTRRKSPEYFRCLSGTRDRRRPATMSPRAKTNALAARMISQKRKLVGRIGLEP